MSNRGHGRDGKQGMQARGRVDLACENIRAASRPDEQGLRPPEGGGRNHAGKQIDGEHHGDV